MTTNMEIDMIRDGRLPSKGDCRKQGGNNRHLAIDRSVNLARCNFGFGYNEVLETHYAAAGSFSTTDFQQRFLGRFSWNVACADGHGSVQIAT